MDADLGAYTRVSWFHLVMRFRHRAENFTVYKFYKNSVLHLLIQRSTMHAEMCDGFNFFELGIIQEFVQSHMGRLFFLMIRDQARSFR
jgi:hypothetical protein